MIPMDFREFLKRFAVVTVLILLLWGAWQARSILLLGFAAVIIAVGISIPTNWLVSMGLRRGWAIAVATVGVGIVAVLLFFLVVPRLLNDLVALLRNIPTAIDALPTLYEQVRNRNPLLATALAPFPSIDSPMSVLTPERARELLNQFLSAGAAIAPTLLGGVGNVLSIVINIALVLFIAIFFLIDPQSYVRASLYLLPQHQHGSLLAIWNELYRTLRVWLSALSLSIVITGALVWFILGFLLGMPNPLVVAVFAGLATFIPNVGVFLPIIPITIFTLTTEPSNLLIYIPVYLIIQLVESNVLTPSIVKAELNIPAGGLMIFQLLMTLAFGALGLLLAVPALAVLIVLVRELYVYDRLKLRDTEIDIEIDQFGDLHLAEQQKRPANSAPNEKDQPRATAGRTRRRKTRNR
ncbi:MAG: AI-2E family transporter [Caldilineaceae bacterium]|nr:AI-2E family transporter [Caldilineaceae bacterium]